MKRLVQTLIFPLALAAIAAACKSGTPTATTPPSKTPALPASSAEAKKNATPVAPVPTKPATPPQATTTPIVKVTPMPTSKPPQPTTATAPAAPTTAAASKPVVVIKTSLGTIEVELDPVNAPVTTRNFLSYVAKRHFDGTIFHRVIANFMIQGGGYTADMDEKRTGAGIVNESNNGLPNKRGTIVMARTPLPDSATAQFFINVQDNPGLDGKPGRPGYAVFGKVVAGMDVVDKIRAVPTRSVTAPNGQPMGDVPVQTVTIESVTQK
jgi:cyclophilin family peptidyl-prolyl cis-trans isomerase